ncbi:class I SAM-dependent methyltransferase [Streptosporangium sp. NPDC023825]|uniref:class I SAM-dependent methyltransferase n=1 Tax=Streptosporangium sp. NPDC023825 TaxID=3154909 RepID=UPI0034449E28
MHWAQDPEHGPGAEILGDLLTASVVELGCGPGHHLAHVASSGATGVGVDIAAAQIERARASYGHLPSATFVLKDAAAFLTGTGDTFDICCSVFGAIGLTPLDILLPAIAVALRPGGLLAFSVPLSWADPPSPRAIPMDTCGNVTRSPTGRAAQRRPGSTTISRRRITDGQRIEPPRGLPRSSSSPNPRSGSCLDIWRRSAHGCAPSAHQGAKE